MSALPGAVTPKTMDGELLEWNLLQPLPAGAEWKPEWTVDDDEAAGAECILAAEAEIEGAKTGGGSLAVGRSAVPRQKNEPKSKKPGKQRKRKSKNEPKSKNRKARASRAKPEDSDELKQEKLLEVMISALCLPPLQL